MSRMKVELLHIHKRFGAVQANRDVSLRVEAGTIHGLLGENGAGKSTLVKILSGFLRCDQGEIWIDGQPVRIDSPAAAIRLGIGMLHQDPLDFPSLTVLENFIAGQRGRLGLGLRESRRRLEKACEEFGFNLNPDGAIGSLTVGERQQLEMLRLLSLGINTLILDEPTTGISAAQKDLLFAALRRLAEQGKSVIFVSHKLADVECLCDRVTVMRQGEVVGELPVRGEDIALLEQQLIDWMFGRELTPPARPHSPQRRADPLLELRSLVVRHEPFALALPDLAVQPGEVIGLAGLEGSGQRSFLLTCAGLLPPRRGRILLGGAGDDRPSLRRLSALWGGVFSGGSAAGRADPRLNLAGAFCPPAAGSLDQLGSGPSAGPSGHRTLQYSGSPLQPGGATLGGQPAAQPVGSLAHTPESFADGAPNARVGH